MQGMRRSALCKTLRKNKIFTKRDVAGLPLQNGRIKVAAGLRQGLPISKKARKTEEVLQGMRWICLYKKSTGKK
jgi:hypothetical protein